MFKNLFLLLKNFLFAWTQCHECREDLFTACRSFHCCDLGSTEFYSGEKLFLREINDEMHFYMARI